MAQGNQSNYFVHPLLRARDWQDRPEFDRVCEWWRAGGKGVCGLVGMGGAGKTAIADRFLHVLPGVMPEDLDAPRNPSLPTPNSTFVFSFYDAPNPEAFFEALQMWLAGSPNVDPRVSFNQLIFIMQKAEPGLMILDGLEKVQEDGAKGIFGRLSSPNLRNFINRVAGGWLPNLSALITTRFHLADLRETKPQFFKSIPIEQIDIPMGIQLIRKRGVRGTNLQLEQIVKECGQHALTVDFAGGYIKEYGNGDPNTPLDLGTAGELGQAAEEEQDDDRREVLKQGFRFARVAQRYRDAMLKNDEAALALLERICLFRLGVDTETLAAIFTGPDAEKVSGKALASLDTNQLQKKLDWLVRMRIVEQSESDMWHGHPGREDMGKMPMPQEKIILYNIHPAVRDGFLSDIGREDEQASHEAIRQGLEVSLADAPGDNPSNPATLDQLEEIVYHAISSGHVKDAWDIYRNRIGGYGNLGDQLGTYERGERICRAFAAGQSPLVATSIFASGSPPGGAGGKVENLAVCPYKILPEDDEAFFINEWALYIKDLGHLATAAHCYEVNIEMRLEQDNWANASVGKVNLSDVWLLAGRLTPAQKAASDALILAEAVDKATLRESAYSFCGTVHELQGAVGDALNDFRSCLQWQHVAEGTDRPLYGFVGVQHALLFVWIGRHDEAQQLTEANKEILIKYFGPQHWAIPTCHLILSEVSRASGKLSSARGLCDSAREWALARDAREVLCWSSLVTAKIELSAFSDQQSTEEERQQSLERSRTALKDGFRIARNCGYGIYHIDLLLVRAAVALHKGRADDTLHDLKIALNEGIPVNDQTGQPELLAATDPECGYAWGIAEGLHLHGEALLLKAAQTLGEDSFVPAKRDQMRSDVRELIKQAESLLNEALKRWYKLRDPEQDNANFVHPETGEEYNYRAAETFEVLKDLTGGILTPYPLKPIDSEHKPQPKKQHEQDMEATTSPKVFISYSHDSDAHDNRVRELSDRLRSDGIDCDIDQYNPNPTQGWPLWMDEQAEQADFVLVVCTKRYTQRSQEKQKSGVRFESVLILQDLYDAGMINNKFIPVLYDKGDFTHIVKWLRPFNHYVVNDDDGYELLRRRLLDDPVIVMPPLGIPIKKGPTNS